MVNERLEPDDLDARRPGRHVGECGELVLVEVVEAVDLHADALPAHGKRVENRRSDVGQRRTADGVVDDPRSRLAATQQSGHWVAPPGLGPFIPSVATSPDLSGFARSAYQPGKGRGFGP